MTVSIYMFILGLHQ